MTLNFGPRRATYINIEDELKTPGSATPPEDLSIFEDFDLLYRSLCAVLFNYVPLSGHPGGSISIGRHLAALLFETLDYDLSDPDRPDADVISFAAGHKALGLYAMWALRNEIARVGAPELLPKNEALQFRLEDLLGFRRNPINTTPLFTKLRSRALDGHPTPATPFVRLSTGASGVGLSASLGLAFGALDFFGAGNPPKVHILEGEGGLTPGRVSEALAAAGTASLKNAIVHIDWNQGSIDSDKVCREGDKPGDYVQWTPIELAYMHDWNVISVPQGFDFRQILAAQQRAAGIGNSQPTAIVYRTVKGWQYGIQGAASHGAGHALCSAGFFKTLEPLTAKWPISLPGCQDGDKCKGGNEAAIIEECFWEALNCFRRIIESHGTLVETLCRRLSQARARLNKKKLAPRQNAPQIKELYTLADKNGSGIPDSLRLEPNTVTSLRVQLGRILGHYNKVSGGAVFVAAADLLASTGVNCIAAGFPAGYYNSVVNPGARTLSLGGICEDAMSGILSGLSTYGRHIGVASSYGAFMAPLGHIAARLHSIGNQARRAIANESYKPVILICAHAGLKTGEDGPTHADPQPLQLLEENFPKGTMITLTPWDPAEIWTLTSAALSKRPAIIAPFVTRPNEKVLDRRALGLAPETAASTGIYLLKGAEGKRDGTVVLQGSEVAYAFIEGALPLLKKRGIDLDVYYVASVELFDMLPEEQRERIFPTKLGEEAMGITGFTLPTMYRWIRSDWGRKMTLYPFREGHYLGSGQAQMVVAEAGLDGVSQFNGITAFLKCSVKQQA